MVKLCKNRQQLASTKKIQDTNRHETGVKYYKLFFPDIAIEIDFEFSSQLLSRYLWACVSL